MRAYLDLKIGSEDLEPFGSLPRIRINKHIFSGGETHLTIKDLNELEGIEEVIILCHGRTHNVMELLQANDILKNNGIERVELYMPYFYYSRQDRATTPESSYALRIFCTALQMAGFYRIHTHDIHSYVANQFLPRLLPYAPVDFLKTIWAMKEYDYIIAPDEGATKKIASVCNHAGISSDKIITATKHRDPATGQLGDPSMAYVDILKLMNKRALIFDDICDGGYTFIQLAKFLEKEVKCNIDLAVTHGIFNKGTDVLKSHFETIYTTDSMPDTHGTIVIKHKVVK